MKINMFFIFFVFCIVACGGSTIDILGTWSRANAMYPNPRYTLIFNADGSFSATVEELSEQTGETSSETTNGQYSISGSTLTITDDACGNVEGKYSVSRDNSTLTITLSEDECETDRDQTMAGSWSLSE